MTPTLRHPSPPSTPLRGLLTALGLVGVLFGCDSELKLIEEEPLPSTTVTLRVENISEFTYDALYAHSNPTLNLDTARELTQAPIEPQTFTVIEHPAGAYISAVRSLVERGPKVAIRSEAPLSPDPEHGRLLLLDEGFLLAP